MVCMSPRDYDRHGGTQLKKEKIRHFHIVLKYKKILLWFMNLHIIDIKQQKQIKNMIF